MGRQNWLPLIGRQNHVEGFMPLPDPGGCEGDGGVHDEDYNDHKLLTQILGAVKTTCR